MPDLIEVKVDSLRVSLTNQQRIIVLKQVDDDRYLPIWIGPYESESITIALQEVEISRPQTHDLVKNAINLLNGKILNATIKDLRDDIFYGVLNIEVDGKTVILDSRPSDAIAVAIRAHVPIYVAKKVMDEASIIPDEIEPEDIEGEEGEEATSEPSIAATSKQNKDRLTIFADYLESKDADENSNDDQEEDDSGQDEDKEE